MLNPLLPQNYGGQGVRPPPEVLVKRWGFTPSAKPDNAELIIAPLFFNDSAPAAHNFPSQQVLISSPFYICMKGGRKLKSLQQTKAGYKLYQVKLSYRMKGSGKCAHNRADDMRSRNTETL